MNRLSTRMRSRSVAVVGPLALAMALALLVGPAARSAHAELTPQQKQEMKAIYERATRAYDVGKYAEAIVEYQKAYEIGGDPPMLYNIAQAYRLNDQPGEALRFYRRYLQRAPNARNREDVERKMADLEKTVEERRKAQAAAPTPVAPPPATTGTPAVPAAPPPAAPPVVSSPPAASVTVGDGQPTGVSEGPSTGRKVVSWSLLGVGVLAGVGSIIEGQIAKSKGQKLTDQSNMPNPTFFDPTIEKDGKNANLFAIILGVTGGTAAVVGTILLLTGGSSSPEAPAEAPTPVPTARATFTPWLGAGVIGAGADVRF
jgi:tetratricopeptide (TPR) repeat protein